MTAQTPKPTIPAEEPPIEKAVDALREIDREAQATGCFGSVKVKIPYQKGTAGRPEVTVKRTLD